jgi:predicted acyl esterase
MMGYDLYADWVYEGGAFCLQANLGWAIQLAAETARLQGDAAAHLHPLQLLRISLCMTLFPALTECLKKICTEYLLSRVVRTFKTR